MTAVARLLEAVDGGEIWRDATGRWRWQNLGVDESDIAVLDVIADCRIQRTAHLSREGLNNCERLAQTPRRERRMAA